MASELAMQIAILRGMKIFYQDYDTRQEFPYYIPSGKPKRTHMIDARPLPQPDVDPGDCMELLRHMLTDTAILEVSQSNRHNGRYACEVIIHEDLGTSIYAEADTLEFAIATAARDALKGLRDAYE